MIRTNLHKFELTLLADEPFEMPHKNLLSEMTRPIIRELNPKSLLEEVLIRIQQGWVVNIQTHHFMPNSPQKLFSGCLERVNEACLHWEKEAEITLRFISSHRPEGQMGRTDRGLMFLVLTPQIRVVELGYMPCEMNRKNFNPEGETEWTHLVAFNWELGVEWCVSMYNEEYYTRDLRN